MRRALALVGWWLCGCEPALTEGLYEAQALDAGVEEVGVDADQPGGQNLVDFADMRGTWAHARDLSTCVSVAGVTETRSRTLVRVEIAQEGAFLRERHEVCALETTPVLGVQTIIPEAVFEAANPIEVESRLYGAQVGGLYQSGAIVSVWGIRLEDPLRDALPGPEALPDERVYDSDGDGQPGATLKLGGNFCDLWVAQRDVTTVSGLLRADGSIEGGGATDTTQAVLGATNDFCAQSFATRPNPAEGAFRMVRVDRRGINLDADGDGEVSCAEIVAAQGRVTTWREPDPQRCELGD
jgi:hypothetical protein